jgi:hypothetical protein
MGIEQLIATQAQRTAGPSPMQQLSDMQSLQGQQLQNQGRQQSLTANADALDQGKRMRGLQFAANVGQQIKSEQDPKKKAELYAAGLQFAKMNGHDISTLPQQYDDRAQQFLDVAHMQVYAPKEFEAKLRSSLFNGNKTQSSKIYPDGTVIQSTGTGVRVLTASGEELQGKAAMDAVTSAMNAEAEQEKNKYSARAGGTVEGQRGADKAGLEGEIAGAKTAATLDARIEKEPQLQAEITRAKEEAAALVAKRVSELGQSKKIEDATAIYDELKSADLGLIYGRGESLYPTLLRSQAGIDMMAQRDRLIGMLELAAAGEMKGQGQITESERKILKDSVTTLNKADISPRMAKAALDDAMETLMKNAGKTPGASQSSSQTAAPKKEGGQQAPPSAIEYLRNNPELAPQFKQKFGYLPEGF